MRFIDSNFEIIPQESGLGGVYKHVEKVARVSYKSEDKITEDSATRMVNTLIKNKHLACLEHGTIYLTFDFSHNDLAKKYIQNPYSKVYHDSHCVFLENSKFFITTNARVIIENEWQDDLQYMCEPTEFHEKRYTVKFILSAGIGREFTRHRAFSHMQESSRFCNYSRGKFNSELTFIIPRWIYNLQADKASYKDYATGERQDWLMDLSGEPLVNQLSCMDRTVSSYVDLLKHIERDYMFYLTTDESYKLNAEEVRGILPLDIKSELVMTGFASDWIHFFNLRSYIAMTGRPHPDAMYLSNNLLFEFLERDYIKYEQLYKKNKVETSGTEKTS